MVVEYDGFVKDKIVKGERIVSPTPMQDNTPRILIMEDPCRGKLGTVCPGTVNKYIIHYKVCMRNDIPWKEKIKMIRTNENGDVIRKAKKNKAARCHLNGKILI